MHLPYPILNCLFPFANLAPLFVEYITKASVSLLPVLIFLSALIFLDSYKLVKFRSVLLAILAGACACGVCYFVNTGLGQLLGIDFKEYSRYVAPIVEEIFKASYVVYFIRTKRTGFMVDAAILGFAVGAGFACIENIYALQVTFMSDIFVWVIRGFGTAVMHGATTASFAIISKNLSESHTSGAARVFLPGLALAIAIHSFYNHFFLPPLLITVGFLIVLPAVMVFVFSQSERATQRWLGIGFDTDVQVLEMITTGNISETKIGMYLQSLRSRFPGSVVADMLCFLRIHLELSIRAKGILLMRQTGFKTSIDPDVKEKLDELVYLEKSIGKTGQLAILPFLRTSSRDLWQLYMLGKK
jgi:RsiW-degrading membrane proteinase PrsW (M82 family)